MTNWVVVLIGLAIVAFGAVLIWHAPAVSDMQRVDDARKRGHNDG